MKKMMSILFLLSLTITGCVSEKDIAEKVRKVIKEDPTILAEAIKAHPAEVMDALQNAAMSARDELAKKREEDEKKKLEESFDKPLDGVVHMDAIRGPADAPITLIEYSDFECPFCSRGYKTVMELMEKYKGKIRFVYKHLPLSFHQQAMIASKYYEAIRLQSNEKAFKFHDLIFDNQQGLRNGEKFLQEMAKKAGADVAKVKKDLESEKVNKRIQEDMAEAAKFDMQGTPGFLINGVPVRGAYPASEFDKIISQLVEKKKLTL